MVYHLGGQSLGVDDAFSFSISKQSASPIVLTTAADVHPPLYYLLLYYWMMLFGTSVFGMKLLSVLFGVLAIVMVYVVGRQLFDQQVGLLGAFILAISPFNIEFSQEARMYSLMTLLALLSTYFFVRLVRHGTSALFASPAISVGTCFLRPFRCTPTRIGYFWSSPGTSTW